MEAGFCAGYSTSGPLGNTTRVIEFAVTLASRYLQVHMDGDEADPCELKIRLHIRSGGVAWQNERMAPGTKSPDLSPEDVRSALERLLSSEQFTSSPRASRFLRFIVETALAGRQNTLKEYVLGVEVFDRGTDFDPTTDTIVRVEATKLRRRLDKYYGGRGAADAVVISVPKGGYAPQFRRGSHAISAQTRPVQDVVSIAVLPFVNLSSDGSDAFWADGLTDELTSVLSRASGLRVISRTSSGAFRDRKMDVRRIGDALGAAMLMEGSVRRQSDRVRVSAQLTEVATGVHLWSGIIERKVSDAWAVQEEIAQAVVDGAHVELTSGEQRRIAKRHTANSEAFEFYLRGCHALDRFDVRSQKDALALFERATAADPEYALPLLGIARTNRNLVMLGAAPPKDIVPYAKNALEKALALDPDFAEAHSLLASLIARHEWDWAKADHHHHMALRLAPNTAEVHDEYATSYLAPRGRIEEALAENRIARQLDPLAAQLSRSYVLILILARRLRDAEREAKAVLGQRPNDGFVRVMLALALHGQKRIAEALVEYKRLYEDDPSIQHEAFVADVLALSGDREPALSLLQRLRGISHREFVPAMVTAWLHAHLGDVEAAITAIEKAYENREYELLVAKTGYGFDPFREHPRFRAVMDRLGLD